MKNKVERLWPQANSHQNSLASRTPTVRGESKEVDELRTALEEQKLSLAKAERRINRLIGERSQLSSLLEKREKKIDELNRELGKFESAELLAGSLGQERRDVWKWIDQVIAAVSGQISALVSERSRSATLKDTASAAIEAEPSGKTPIGSRIGDGADKQVVGVLLVGLVQDEIESLLPSIERDCASKGLRPLLVVDIDAFEIFRAHDLPFEYIPPAAQREQFDSSLNWDLYLQRRLSIIRKKWDPIKLVAFGDRATATLKLWSTSPFEETPLLDIAGRSGSS
jgi:hypothetical protein